MSAATAVFKREFKSYFGTPLAYVFLALFLLVSSAWMYAADFFLRGEASMRLFFAELPWLFAFFAPLISMGMWAEERRTGTIEMLLTLPITTGPEPASKLTMPLATLTPFPLPRVRASEAVPFATKVTPNVPPPQPAEPV